MSDLARRRTAAALLLAASLGVVGVSEAHAGSRRLSRTPAGQSVAVRLHDLNEMIRSLWNGTLGILTAVTGTDTSPGSGDKPPSQNQARDGAGLDPHGGGPNNPRP